VALTVEGICALFERQGGRMYSGEPVTQMEHALQTAHAAECSGAEAALITAALLHDLGHLLNDQGETPTARGIDDIHQYAALPFLRPLFDDDVLEPIRLHVEAKRYLCATQPQYHDALSADSVRSLALQGGLHTGAEARAFIAQPGAQHAVQLRQWDDAAKVADLAVPPLAHFVPIMQASRRDRR
jgi:phosphonate degradation associated HDIG domain protein